MSAEPSPPPWWSRTGSQKKGTDIDARTDLAPPRWPTFGVTLIPALPAGNAQLFPGLGLVRRGPVRLLEQLTTT